MNRNTIFALMALEMANIAELMNNIVVVVDIETDLSNDFPTPPTEEEVIADWLETDCGLKMGTTYAPNEKMVALSLTEMKQIKKEMDYLRVRANEGEELARKIQSIQSEFFPQA